MRHVRTFFLDDVNKLVHDKKASAAERNIDSHPTGILIHIATERLFSSLDSADSGLKTVAEGVGGWRCIVVEKLSGGELQSGVWHMEPRSNRQTCVEEVDFDADVQRGEDPQ
jgi:hypothetical protein